MHVLYNHIYACIYIWYTYMTWVQMFAACILYVQFWIHYLQWDKCLERSDELISATRSSGKPTMANLLSDAEQCIEQLPVLLKGHLELQVFFSVCHGGLSWYHVICGHIMQKGHHKPKEARIPFIVLSNYHIWCVVGPSRYLLIVWDPEAVIERFSTEISLKPLNSLNVR